jgi:hypothetical protein
MDEPGPAFAAAVERMAPGCRPLVVSQGELVAV